MKWVDREHCDVSVRTPPLHKLGPAFRKMMYL